MAIRPYRTGGVNMKSLELYKLLQGHVARLNRLAVDLYNGNVETDAAQAEALKETSKTLDALKAG